MADLTAIEQDDPEKIDLMSPEDVLIEIKASNPDFVGPLAWNHASITTTMIINGVNGIMGAASYDACYGCFLNYTIENMIECPGQGWWVVTGMTGHYMRGDGWTTDDDMDFYYDGLRPATQEEIEQA